MDMRLFSTKLTLYQRSLVKTEDAEFGLAQTDIGNQLVILTEPGSTILNEFEGEYSEFEGQTLAICPMSHSNTDRLRVHLNWLIPIPLGLRTSAGMGDRLGIATPGHVRAIRDMQGTIAPIFAQQSMREMNRTGRNPQQVMDDATWGIFEEGWRGEVGADADHLKTRADIDACIAQGFTFYTIDPGEFVNNLADKNKPGLIKKYVDDLPDRLQPRATGLLRKSFHIEGYKFILSDKVLYEAAVKYGKAIAHVANLYEYLEQVAGNRPFELEISMDETELPTTPEEHIYIACELKRLGVKWVSFAPRFIGRFEKGVDYIGDLHTFKESLAIHAAIARQLGPYKLSLHSGSDKFSIYSIFMEETRGLAHLKTAGTSYLEALRTIGSVDTDLFREIYEFALERYDTDKLSYHVSAQIDKAPRPNEVKDWPGLLNQFDAREILHVTFGSVLTVRNSAGMLRFYDRIRSILNVNREAYFDNLEKHFIRHLQPFSARAGK